MVITGWDPVIWGPVSDSVRIKAFSPAHLDTGGYGPTPFTARDSGRPQPSPDIVAKFELFFVVRFSAFDWRSE